MALHCVVVCISVFVVVVAVRVDHSALSSIEIEMNVSDTFHHVNAEVQKNASEATSAMPMTAADILCRGGLAGNRRYRKSAGGVDAIDERLLLEAMAPVFHQDLSVINPRGNRSDDREMINQMLDQALGGPLLQVWTPQQAFVTYAYHKDEYSAVIENTWRGRFTTWAEKNGWADAQKSEAAFVTLDLEANNCLLKLFLEDVREKIIENLERLVEQHMRQLTHMLDWMWTAQSVLNGQTFSQYVSQANPGDTTVRGDGSVAMAGASGRYIEMDSIYVDRWQRAWEACPSPLRCPVPNCPIPNPYQPAFSNAEVNELQQVQTNVAWQAVNPNANNLWDVNGNFVPDSFAPS